MLHWHGDTFDLPPGATLLASTPLCKNQAFSYGGNANAFQFHPEAGGPGLERWLLGHTAELTAAGVNVNQLRADWLAQLARQRRCTTRPTDFAGLTKLLSILERHRGVSREKNVGEATDEL